MPTAILDKLLQSQFGKSFIMWVFLAMCAAIVALGWIALDLMNKLEACNTAQMVSERAHSDDRANMIREQVDFYKNILQRLDAVEKKRK